MFARCLLDAWDTVYYLLPGIFALAVWESVKDGRRVPVLALSLCAAAWAQFQWLPGRVSPDFQAAVFLAWMLPLTTTLAASLFELSWPRALMRAPRRNVPQQTTVSSLGSFVSTSHPSPVRTTRSSIRTPTTSGT